MGKESKRNRKKQKTTSPQPATVAEVVQKLHDLVTPWTAAIHNNNDRSCKHVGTTCLDYASVPGALEFKNALLTEVERMADASVTAQRDPNLVFNTGNQVIGAMQEANAGEPIPLERVREAISAMAGITVIFILGCDDVPVPHDFLQNAKIRLTTIAVQIIRLVENAPRLGGEIRTFDIYERVENLDSFKAYLDYLDARIPCDCLKSLKRQYKNDDSGICRQCCISKKDTELFDCSGCCLVKYCGKDCQYKDWQSHRKFCKAVSGKVSKAAFASPAWKAKIGWRGWLIFVLIGLLIVMLVIVVLWFLFLVTKSIVILVFQVLAIGLETVTLTLRE